MDSECSQSDLIVNQSLLHIMRTGNGSLPPLVVAHGLSDNRLCWHDTALDLETRTDVIIPDSRGHGLSARLARDEAIDMAGIISALGLRRPIVSDHSMCRRAVTRLGAHYPDRPGLMSLEGEIDEPGQPADHLDF